MALVFRQQIVTNALEVYALYNAISNYIFTPLTSDRKVTPAEFLSVEPLRKVGTRLYSKYMRYQENGRANQFPFTFSPQELVAIYLCIRNYKADPVLQVVLGKIQQKALNFEGNIELNFKTSFS